MSKYKRFCTVLLLSISIFSASAFSQAADQSLSKSETEKWREDLRLMAQEMPKRHKNLFHQMTLQQYESAVKNLDARISQFTRSQIIVQMMRIVAMVGDGHTNIYPTRDPKIAFHILPIKLYLFNDGLYIRAARKKQAQIVGARVVKIGEINTEQAIFSVREIIGRDNEMDVKYFAPQLLVMPEIIQALGMSESSEKTRFVIEKDGREQSIDFNQIGLAEAMPADTDMTWFNKEGWVDMRDKAVNPLPLWLKNPADKFWFEMLPDKQTLYVQLNQVGNQDNETLAGFSERLSAYIADHPVEKLVLDLRLNRGGDGTLLKPLVVGLIKSKINQPNKFYTIIGRSTFSAAQFLVDDLEKYTNTIFVGEPSGSKGNVYGDSRKLILPNSGITVRTSIYYWQGWHPLDTRQWTAPSLNAELSSENYAMNIDPALEAIQTYVPQPSLSELLEDAIFKSDVMLGREIFQQYRAKPINKYRFLQNDLFALTKSLLKEKKPDMALEILKINAETYPESIFAFLYLGEVYLAKGDKNLAQQAYRKVLELNPENTDAQDKLKTLALN